MPHGELLTRLTIWLALIAYGIGAAMLLASSAPAWRLRARLIWTLGFLFFAAHVACAFAHYHGWSHAAAYRDTARQTADLTGLDWGGGLYINYLFALAWLADVLSWWIAPQRFARRPAWLTILWHSFFLFMVINGAVVFGKGPVRWLGAAICVLLASLWWRTRSTRES
jgi:hypothetical protein